MEAVFFEAKTKTQGHFAAKRIALSKGILKIDYERQFALFGEAINAVLGKQNSCLKKFV